MIDDRGIPLYVFIRNRSKVHTDADSWPWEAKLGAWRPEIEPNVAERRRRSNEGLREQLSILQGATIRRDTFAEANASRLTLITGPEHTKTDVVYSPVPATSIMSCDCGWATGIASSGTGSCSCRDVATPFQLASNEMRIVTVSNCSHYIAVSYRWQSDLEGQTIAQRSEEVVMRAKAFAVHYGYSLLWMDQFCVNQQAEGEKLHIIQVMDIIYQNAAVCLALLDFSLDTQAELDTFAELLEISPHPETDAWWEWRVQMKPERAWTWFHVLQKIVSDKYFTRAWITQENTAAVFTILLVRCDKDLNIPAHLGKMAGEVQVPLCMLRQACAKVGALLNSFEASAISKRAKHLSAIWEEEHPHEAMFNRHSRQRPDQSHAYQIQFMDQMIERLSTEQKCLTLFLSSVRRRSHHGKRLALNAAEAMAILSNKACHDVRDRLAIMGNLCSYSTRLDLERLVGDWGLMACAFAQSLLNGDLSMARLSDSVSWNEVGMTYDTLEGSLLQRQHNRRGILDSSIDLEIGPFGFSWAPRIIERQVDVPRQRDSRRYKISFLATPAEFHLHGWLWRFHSTLDASDLQEQSRKVWETTDDRVRDFLAVECYLDLIELATKSECTDGAHALWLNLEASRTIATALLTRSLSAETLLSLPEHCSVEREGNHPYMSPASRPSVDPDAAGAMPNVGWLVRLITDGKPLRLFALESPGSSEHPLMIFEDRLESMRLFTPDFEPEAPGSTQKANLAWYCPGSWPVSFHEKDDDLTKGEELADMPRLRLWKPEHAMGAFSSVPGFVRLPGMTSVPYAWL